MYAELTDAIKQEQWDRAKVAVRKIRLPCDEEALQDAVRLAVGTETSDGRLVACLISAKLWEAAHPDWPKPVRSLVSHMEHVADDDDISVIRIRLGTLARKITPEMATCMFRIVFYDSAYLSMRGGADVLETVMRLAFPQWTDDMVSMITARWYQHHRMPRCLHLANRVADEHDDEESDIVRPVLAGFTPQEWVAEYAGVLSFQQCKEAFSHVHPRPSDTQIYELCSQE